MQLGMTFLDGTNIRAHQKAAGATKKVDTSDQRDTREALGRSQGGFGTKACVIANAAGRAIVFVLAAGQAHELTAASLAAYVAFFAIGLGPVFWLLISESFPLAIGARGMSAATIAN